MLERSQEKTAISLTQEKHLTGYHTEGSGDDLYLFEGVLADFFGVAFTFYDRLPTTEPKIPIIATPICNSSFLCFLKIVNICCFRSIG